MKRCIILYNLLKNNIVVNTFSSLIAAYKSVDTESTIFPVKTFLKSEIDESLTISDLDELQYAAILNEINLVSSTKYLDKIYILVPTTDQIQNYGLNNYYIVTDDKFYLYQFNKLLSIIQSEYSLASNDTFTQQNIKQYLRNHISEFLNITIELIEKELYSKFAWSTTIPEITNTIISNDDEIISNDDESDENSDQNDDIESNTSTIDNSESYLNDPNDEYSYNIDDETEENDDENNEEDEDNSLTMTYDTKFSNSDKYFCVRNNVIYSSDEYQVLRDFMDDIDYIIPLIMSNKDELTLSRSLTQLI